MYDSAKIEQDKKPTFNIPEIFEWDLPLQAGPNHAIGEKTTGALPNIKGDAVLGTTLAYTNTIAATGAFSPGSGLINASFGPTTGAMSNGAALGFDAAKYNSLYSDSQTKVGASGVFVNWCIKY